MWRRHHYAAWRIGVLPSLCPVGEVAPGADGDLEHIALGLRADPLPTALEEDALEEAHRFVEARGRTIP
jgi:hypothetical protein